MEGKARRIELRTNGGEIILSFILTEKEIFLENNLRNETNNEQTGKEGKDQVGSGSNDSPMTEAQKRYLFRILADHGVQGELAHKELKNAFRVNSLTDVSKFEASKMIERLLGEGIGGLKNGTPIQ